jgi:hypothetical protein
MSVTAKSIKELKLISFQGQQFLGKVEVNRDELTTKITSALPLDSCDAFEDSIAAYIQAENAGKLETMEITGDNVHYISKGFNEEQEMQIDIIVAKANHAIKFALINLQNQAIAEVC